jgi:hypothetical protein
MWKKNSHYHTYDTALYLAEKFECEVFSKKNGENRLMQTFEKKKDKINNISFGVNWNEI